MFELLIAMVHKNILHTMVAVMLLALVLPGACASSSSEEGYITVGLAPVANFDALYAYNTVPATVAFRDLSTGTTPITYLWEFGDGATSTEQNPSHNYIRQGMYTVRLTVTNMYRFQLRDENELYCNRTCTESGFYRSANNRKYSPDRRVY